VKARPVGVRAALPVVITGEIVALAAFSLLPRVYPGWWLPAVITAVAVLLMLITVHRRNLPQWVGALRRWRRVRTRPAVAAAAVDVPHGNLVCGVRTDAYEAITMVEVTGRAYAPTFLRGSTVSLTPNLLPLHVLTELLDQPGVLRLASIDVVSSGQRVRRASGYPPLYSTLLADRPAAGQRTTRLIVRLDLIDSAPGLTYRRSIGAAAAAATERIVNALLQQGIRANALNAAELDNALAELGAGLAEAPQPPAPESDAASESEAEVRTPALAGAAVGAPGASGAVAGASGRPARHADVGWHTVNAHPGHLTSYYYSPEDITTANLNHMWSLRSDHVVQLVSLRKKRRTDPDGGGPVMVSAMVRTEEPQRPQQPPTLYLNTLPGDQFAAVLRAAPTARPRLQLPERPLPDPAELAIPIGSTGILIGAAEQDNPRAKPPIQRDDLVMWSLTDPQRATRIVMDTSDFYIRQLLVRAAAVGERIAIYTSQPRRWEALSQPMIAVMDRGRAPDFVPTIIVNDRASTPPSAGLASTVITLGRAERGPAPDLRFVQTSPSSVRVSTVLWNLDLAIVAFRQEQGWTGG
jgi:type VII secretion protein EccE